MKLPLAPLLKRPRLAALWAAEGCVAAAAVITLARGGGPRELLGAAAYLALCVAALLVPGPLLQRAAGALGLSPRRRRLALQLYLVLAAGAVAATLSTGRGWAAVVAVLLTGNALLALELESRGAFRVGAPPAEQGSAASRPQAPTPK